MLFLPVYMAARSVLLALLVLALAAAAYYLGASATKGPTAAASAAPASTAPATYYVPQTAGAAWPAEKLDDYTCTGTINPGWCTLPSPAAAEAYCSTDPACIGYVLAGNSGWAAPILPAQNNALLVTKPPTGAPPANSQSNTYFVKMPAAV